jgi:hypothetical protein
MERVVKKHLKEELRRDENDLYSVVNAIEMKALLSALQKELIDEELNYE